MQDYTIYTDGCYSRNNDEGAFAFVILDSEEREVKQRFSLVFLAIHFLFYLPLVMADKTVGSLYNQLCRPIVALKFEELGIVV